MRTVNSQKQEQKTIVEGQVSQGNSNVVLWYMLCILLFTVGVLLLWVLTSSFVHVVLILCASAITAVMVGISGVGIYHNLFMGHYERVQVRNGVHFFHVGDMVIGDETTQGYRHFYVPPTNVPRIVDANPKDEPYFTPQEDMSSEAIQKELIRRDKDDLGLTYQQIADKYEDMTVAKVRRILGRTGR